MLFGAAGDDALEHVGEVGQRVEAVELGGLDQGESDGPMLGGARRAGEQRILARQGNRRDILPISGRRWSFIIVGTRCMAAD